jgi:hypothetical protein
MACLEGVRARATPRVKIAYLLTLLAFQQLTSHQPERLRG